MSAIFARDMAGLSARNCGGHGSSNQLSGGGMLLDNIMLMTMLQQQSEREERHSEMEMRNCELAAHTIHDELQCE